MNYRIVPKLAKLNFMTLHANTSINTYFLTYNYKLTLDYTSIP